MNDMPVMSTDSEWYMPWMYCSPSSIALSQDSTRVIAMSLFTRTK